MEVRSQPNFELVARNGAGTMQISIAGELDLSVVPKCRETLDEPLSSPAHTITMDLGDVEFIDSTGLRFLVDVKRRADGAKKRLVLGPVSVPVLKLLEVTGLLDWFTFAQGAEPELSTCPMCDKDRLAVIGRRCPHCGAA